MPKAHVIITAITIQGLSYRQVATQYGVSKSWAHQLHKRWLADGENALTPTSRRPRSSPNAIPESLRQRILQLRLELTSTGFDAGAHTIAEHLTREGHTVSLSTIWRTLRRAEVVTPQPQKRPRSSYQRFTADQPNSMWQSDFTHWALANGRDTEIIGIIQKNGRPYKPTTQGKIERLWQTLKLFLTSQNTPTTLDELQHQLDTFRNYYNHVRPHRALARRTPHTAYTLIPKAEPSSTPGAIWKVR